MIVFLVGSCKKDELKYLDNFIQAGQKNIIGIEYIDLVPDINCIIIDPWYKTDTIIHLDLNKDGINDFSIEGSIYHPSMLGADREYLSIIPLLSNEVCINPISNWLDTIPYLDTIGVQNNWTNDEALIHLYYGEIYGYTFTEGYWGDVSSSSNYYIGFKIIKNEKTFYGWIGMKRNAPTQILNFQLTDYAILKEYAE